MRIPLASKSDPAKRPFVSDETLVNLYALKSPQGARQEFYLNRTPGELPFVRHSAELCRGLYAFDDELLDVRGQSLISIMLVGDVPAYSVKGVIPGTGDVTFSRNSATTPQVTIITESGAYKYEGGTVTLISSGLPATPSDADNADGFTLYALTDGRVFYSSLLDTDTINALDFFTVEGNAGDLLAVKVVGKEIVFWKEQDFSIFRNTGDADNPFQPLGGTGKPFGIINKHAKAVVGGVLCWVDNFGVVRQMGAGYTPVAISNEGVQGDIAALEDKSEIRLWQYIDGRNGFLVVRSSEFCWVYDFAEQRWHNRQSYQRTTYRSKHCAYFANKNLVAPDQSGDLFELSNTTFTEDDGHIVSEWTTPPLGQFPVGQSMFALDLEIECGTATYSPEADADPEITMFVSIDGGRTWSTGRKRSLGTRGQYRKQVRWTRLGQWFREGARIKFSTSIGIPFTVTDLNLVPSRPRAA